MASLAGFAFYPIRYRDFRCHGFVFSKVDQAVANMVEIVHQAPGTNPSPGDLHSPVDGPHGV